jgi:hypothetical protein
MSSIAMWIPAGESALKSAPCARWKATSHRRRVVLLHPSRAFRLSSLFSKSVAHAEVSTRANFRSETLLFAFFVSFCSLLSLDKDDSRSVEMNILDEAQESIGKLLI